MRESVRAGSDKSPESHVMSSTGLTSTTIAEEGLASPARPLDDATRSSMERFFHHDFGRVRVHCESESARALGARAYTVGDDIVFGRGQYAPDTTSGRHLLVHELTHVAQQLKQPTTADGGHKAVTSPGDAIERAADANVARASAGCQSAATAPVGVSPNAAGLIIARATVSDYSTTALDIPRSDIAAAKALIPGLNRLNDVYDVSLAPGVSNRFRANPEEQDAVFDVAWTTRPATLAAEVDKTVSIPARGPAAALAYTFTYTPKPPGKAKAKDEILITFLSEAAAATVVRPTATPGASPPKDSSWGGFPQGETSETYFKKHADEGLQLFGWIAAQTAGGFDQIVVTSETASAGKTKPHESSLRVTKMQGVTDVHVEFLGEGAVVSQAPAANYRRDEADDLIEKAQSKGDPGQGSQPDKLGQITGVSSFPVDERFSVKFFAYKLFETSTDGGKKVPGLRDSESKGVVNIEGTTKQVLIAVTVAKATVAKTYDMDVKRIGVVGQDAEIDPTKVKPDVGRAVGFPTSGDVAAVRAFLTKRYPALTGATGTTPAALRDSVNALLETQATTSAYFSANYGVSILAGASAATRLQSVHHLKPEQTQDMEDFTGPEMTALELALETVSDPLITVLKGTAFSRQKAEIVDKGARANPRFEISTKHSGITQVLGAARTIILFDSYRDNGLTSFMGSRSEAVLPIADETSLHEIGHAVDASTSARAAFNRKFPHLRGFTDYARSNSTAEAFEEAFAIFQGDPEWLHTNHRDVFDWFTTLAATGRVPSP